MCIVCHSAPKRSDLAKIYRRYPEVVILGKNGSGPDTFIENGEVELTEEANWIYRIEARRLFYLAFVKRHQRHNPKWAKRWLRALEN